MAYTAIINSAPHLKGLIETTKTTIFFDSSADDHSIL